jgi:hypothetical protein
VEFSNRGAADAVIRGGNVLLCLSPPPAPGTTAPPLFGPTLSPGSCPAGAVSASLPLNGAVRAPAGGRAAAQFSGPATVNFPPEGAVALGYVDAFDDRGQRVQSTLQQFAFSVSSGAPRLERSSLAPPAPCSSPRAPPDGRASPRLPHPASRRRWND